VAEVIAAYYSGDAGGPVVRHSDRACMGATIKAALKRTRGFPGETYFVPISQSVTFAMRRYAHVEILLVEYAMASTAPRILRVGDSDTPATENLDANVSGHSLLEAFSRPTSTKNLLVMVDASLIPKHRVKPQLKTNSCTRSMLRSCSGPASSQRSGRKTLGSGRNTSFIRSPGRLSPMLVPPGMKVPCKISPPFGTTRSRSAVMGGKTRRPSLMHACR